VSVITDILGAPIAGIGKAVAAVADAVSGDATKRQAAAAALQESLVELQAKAMDADTAFAQAQAQVITAEVKEGWLAANWRPLIMLMFGFIILNNYILDPWFHIGQLQLPPDLWSLLKIGMGGYIYARSAEKLVNSDGVANIASMITGKPLANINDIADASKKGVKVN
jgi:Holin of 3TMs, for gene-transfer release